MASKLVEFDKICVGQGNLVLPLGKVRNAAFFYDDKLLSNPTKIEHLDPPLRCVLCLLKGDLGGVP